MNNSYWLFVFNLKHSYFQLYHFCLQYQIMNKNLEKACKSDDFMELYKIIESKTINPSLVYKDINLNECDFDYLKQYTLSSMLKILNTDSRIPNTLIKLTEILGECHVKSAKTAICNFIVSKKIMDISIFIQNNFQDLRSLKKLYDFLEISLDSLTSTYDNLPAEWGADIMLVSRSLIMIKQTLCDYFFNCEIDAGSYSLGLIYTINFEKKLDVFLTTRKCCVGLKFSEDEIHVKLENEPKECVHKNMLSKVFIPHIEIFVEHAFANILSRSFDQKSVEKGMITIFLDFFRKLENVYDILSFFSDSDVYLKLGQTADQALFTLLKRTKIEEKPERMAILISSVLFVQQVFEEFINTISSKYQVSLLSSSIEAARKLERSQLCKIEKEFNNNFSGKLSDFEKSYSIFLSASYSIPESVKKFILEICISQIFAKISTTKMNPKTAEKLSKEIEQLEAKLRNEFNQVPFIKTISDYIGIFKVSPEDSESFISNFEQLSLGRFELNQILKVLEDQKSAMKLYTVYKKYKK